jgi:hypothetical protein
MQRSLVLQFPFLFALTILVTGQQECYFGPGAQNRGPANLVPCNGTGTSTCCLLGDTCLSGNTCYNYATGDLYQYGCTDIEYKDASCPYKCGFDPSTPFLLFDSIITYTYYTDIKQPCHHGRLSSTAPMSRTLLILGCVMHQKVAAASGKLHMTCWYSSPFSVKRWAVMRGWHFTHHQH